MWIWRERFWREERGRGLSFLVEVDIDFDFERRFSRRRVCALVVVVVLLLGRRWRGRWRIRSVWILCAVVGECARERRERERSFEGVDILFLLRCCVVVGVPL